jgi:uncharacterized protein involved in cysteine biosynthesis
MLEIFFKSLKDILSPSVIGFIFKIALSSMFLMVLILWIFWDSFSALVEKLVSLIPFIGGFDFVQSASSYLGALIVGYGLIVALISILTSIYSPKLLIKLAKKSYPQIEANDYSKISKSIFYNIKAVAIFIVLLILFLPLIFVPILGQIIMLILWAILLKEPTFYDVSSLFIKDEKEYIGYKSIWIVALVASLFNFIPVINLFAPIFAQIMFMHWLLAKLR